MLDSILFNNKPVICILAISFIACLLFFIFYPLAPLMKTFKFSALPSLFDNGDTYSIMWATSIAATAKLELLDVDGNQTFYTDAVDGLGTLSSRIHRIDIPKELLENGVKYRVSSRKTINARHYGYLLGREITSDYYSLSPYNTTDSLSFLCISDVQGADSYAEKAIANAPKDYDFVVMLGDYANDYNDEEDIIRPLLNLAARASGGTLPVLYVNGNHEIKGTMSRDLKRIIPTPSETDERYYCWSYGKAFFTVLCLGDDHGDDMARYSGISEFDAYKDKEYEWFEQEVLEKKPYEGFDYNLVLVHIPLITLCKQHGTKENPLPEFVEEHFCDECGKAHGYKYAEFRKAIETMNIDLMVSGHTHEEPRIIEHPDCSFTCLEAGSKVDNTGAITEFRNSIVRLTPSGWTYDVYSSKKDRG